MDNAFCHGSSFSTLLKSAWIWTCPDKHVYIKLWKDASGGEYINYVHWCEMGILEVSNFSSNATIYKAMSLDKPCILNQQTMNRKPPFYICLVLFYSEIPYRALYSFYS